MNPPWVEDGVVQENVENPENVAGNHENKVGNHEKININYISLLNIINRI